jgi:hypothetical protein
MTETGERGRDLGVPRSIALATRTGREIPNVQDADLAPLQVKRYLMTCRNRFPRAEIRRLPTGQYNCHGMTFAFRRTQILVPDIVEKILEDDGYHRIRLSEVMPGDLVVYYEGSEVSHSGIVIDVESDDRLVGGGKAAKVMSKWGPGGEYIHYAAECEYAGDGKTTTYWTDRDGHAEGRF